MTMPKVINCRLSDEDVDIKEDLAKAKDRTKRIKEIYRLGLQAERMGLCDKSVETKRAKCFDLAAPSRPRLYVK